MVMKTKGKIINVSRLKNRFKTIIGILLFGYYNYERTIKLNNGNLSINEFRSFMMKKTVGSFCIQAYDDGASNYENIKPHWVKDHHFSDEIHLELNKGYGKESYNYFLKLNIDEKDSIKSMKLRTGLNSNLFMFNLFMSSNCPLFFSYEVSSVIFLLWAMSTSMMRLYTVIKIQNELKRVVLHLEYLFKIHVLEAKQTLIE